MKRWLKTFLKEKEIDLETNLYVETENGLNIIEVGILVEAILNAPEHEQKAIKHNIVVLDFMNQPIIPYLTQLAKAIAY